MREWFHDMREWLQDASDAILWHAWLLPLLAPLLNPRVNLVMDVTLILIALKLVGYIGWSWWFVISPSLIQLVVVLCWFIGRRA